MFRIEYERTLGIVRCETDGLHTAADVRKHADVARSVIERARRKTGSVRTLVLKIGGQVQSLDAMTVDRRRSVTPRR